MIEFLLLVFGNALVDLAFVAAVIGVGCLACRLIGGPRWGD